MWLPLAQLHIPTSHIGISPFTQNIHIPFKADIIKVSNFFFLAENDEDVIYTISSNLINSLDGVLAVLTDKYAFSEPMIFTNDKTISGSYNFIFDKPLTEGTFTMTITFIKN